jgi:hypothetical protein
VRRLASVDRSTGRTAAILVMNPLLSVQRGY